MLAWAQEGAGENTRYADNVRSVPELATGKRRARMVGQSPVASMLRFAATPGIAGRIARARAQDESEAVPGMSGSKLGDRRDVPQVLIRKKR